MDLIMTNGQVGFSSLEGNGILWPSSCKFFQRPIFDICLSRKNLKQGRIFCVSTLDGLSKGRAEESRLSNNEKFIEKQFEFEPMFGEYLKAMESVKSGREKKSNEDAKPRRSSLVKEIPKATSVEGDKESENLGQEEIRERYKLDGFSRQAKEADATVGDGSLKNSTMGFARKATNRKKLEFGGEANGDLKHKSKRISKGGGIGITRDLGKHKMQIKKGNSDWKAERGCGANERDRSLKRYHKKGTMGVVEGEMRESVFDKVLKLSREGRINGISDGLQNLGNQKDFRGNLSQNRSSSKIKEQNLVSDMISEKSQKKYQTDTEVSKSNIQRKLVQKERTGATERRKLIHPSKVEKRMTHSETVQSVEKETNSGSRSHHWHTRNVFERENLGHRSSKKFIKWDRNAIEMEDGGNVISVKRGEFTKGKTYPIEDVEDNDIVMERAAFKSFELLNDTGGRSQVSRMEMEERIQKLAKSLNGADINMPEWLFSKMMCNADIRFSDHSMLRVIQILGKFGNWRRVLQVIEWLQSRERFKSYNGRYIFTTALDVLGKAKRPVEALNVFYAMRQERSLYPDLAAYRCIAVILGQAGHMKELFDVIDCMRSPPPKKFKTGVLDKWNPIFEPDGIIYNAVLNACVRRKQWEGPFWVLQQLKQQGLQPSNTTYGLVMEVMFACGKYNLVHEFFRKVEKSSIPNSLNYRVLVNTLWREGKMDEAVLVVQDMERRGIVGSASLYYDLARCLCSAGRCEEALTQIEKICKVASKPLVVTYTGLIQACLDEGNVKNGAYIFQEMQKFCSPNLVTCNIMLKAYLDNWMFEDAKDLFQKMLENSSNISNRNDYRTRAIPDNYTFNTMLDALAAEDNWDDFRYVYTRMLHHGYNFNARRHLKMILNACRAGKGELLETTWKHLVQAGRVPPASITKERFLMKLEASEYTTAISIIGTYCTNGHAFSEKAWLDLFEVNSKRLPNKTLVRLMNELTTIVAGAYEPNLMFQNVIASCKEFIRTSLAETSSTETE